MSIQRVPGSVLVQRPEFLAVWEAVQAWKMKMPVLATCPDCGSVLTVEQVPNLRSLLIRCDGDCLRVYEPDPSL